MSKKIMKSLTIAGTAMTTVMTAPAFAQSTAEVTNDAIIVTARRIQENVQDVPISMTVLTQEQISARNISSSVDLATYTPSLVVNKRFGLEKASFAIRGFTQDLTTAPTVAVYFADVVAPRLVPNLGGGNGAGPGVMFDLQNVQVLYGPQGTLFGRNTNGGAVLLVPNKPTGNLEGYVEGTVGNYDQRRVQAVLNVPLSETFKVRGGFDWNKRDGYLKNRSGIGPKAFNDIDYFAARLSVVAELTPDLENYTIFSYMKSDTNGTIGRSVYCNPGTDPTSVGAFAVNRADNCDLVARQANYGYWDVDNSNPMAKQKNRVWQVINTTTWQASDSLTVKNIVSYGESKEEGSLSVLGDFVPYPLVIASNGQGGRPQGNQSTFTEELQFQGTAGRFTWQAGAYAEISDPIGQQEQVTEVLVNCTDPYAFMCDPLFLDIPGRGPTPVGSVNVFRHNYTYRNYGIYAQGTYDITDQFAITGGLRYTWDKTRSEGDDISVVAFPFGPVAFRCTVRSAPPGSGAELLTNEACYDSFTEKSGKPTWLINLDYKPTPDILIYAKYSRGYRAGGANYSNVSYETWAPEKVDNYELGVKTTIRGGSVRGTFNVNGFWNDFSNQQVPISLGSCQQSDPRCTMPLGAGIQAIQNVGTSRIRGVEVDGSLTFFDAFRLDYGYAYLDAEVRKAEFPGCNPATFNCEGADFISAGQRLLFSPKHRLTVTGTYTLPLDENLGKLSIGATFTYTASMHYSHVNDAIFAAGQIPENWSIIPSNELLNLNLDWKNIGGSAFDLALFATNVTKEKYRVGAGNSIPRVGAEFITPGETRMYGMRVKYSFGG